MNRQKAIEILNNICDGETKTLDLGVQTATFTTKGNKQDGWTLGVCKVTIDEKYDELLVHTGNFPTLYFSYNDLNKMLEHIVSVNEWEDRQSIIHRLFK